MSKTLIQRIFSKWFFLQLGLIFLVGCVDQSPVSVKPNEQSCAHCRMKVADMRFNAQLVTPKGKRYHFDSIECMVTWVKEHPNEPPVKSYVKDLYHPSKFIEFDQAKILRSIKLPSPMGAFLSAYSSDIDIEKARIEYGGEKLDKEALRAYLEKWASDFQHNSQGHSY